MRKIFIIKNSNFKEISKDKGVIDFLLVDETGEKRTVSAIAKLSRKKRIISVNAIHKRETPLVEALAKASVKDTIEVDFTGFNNSHPRVVRAPLARSSGNFQKTVPESQIAEGFTLTKQQLILAGFFLVALIVIVM